MVLLKTILWELRQKFNVGLYWVLSFLLLSGILASVYDSFVEDQEASAQLFEVAPAQILEAFNIGEDYLSDPESFITGQFFTLFSLAGSIIAAYLGTSLVAGKIQQRTIVSYFSKRMTRTGFYLAELLVGIIFLYLTSILIAIGVWGLFKLLAEADGPDLEYLLLLLIGCASLHLVFLSFSQFLGVLWNQSRAYTVSLGLAVGLWFLNSISNISGFPDVFKYISPFYYLETDTLLQNYNYNWYLLAVLFVMSIAFSAVGLIAIRQKDIYL